MKAANLFKSNQTLRFQVFVSCHLHVFFCNQATNGPAETFDHHVFLDVLFLRLLTARMSSIRWIQIAALVLMEIHPNPREETRILKEVLSRTRCKLYTTELWTIYIMYHHVCIMLPTFFTQHQIFLSIFCVDFHQHHCPSHTNFKATLGCLKNLTCRNILSLV